MQFLLDGLDSGYKRQIKNFLQLAIRYGLRRTTELVVLLCLSETRSNLALDSTEDQHTNLDLQVIHLIIPVIPVRVEPCVQLKILPTELRH